MVKLIPANLGKKNLSMTTVKYLVHAFAPLCFAHSHFPIHRYIIKLFKLFSMKKYNTILYSWIEQKGIKIFFHSLEWKIILEHLKDQNAHRLEGLETELVIFKFLMKLITSINNMNESQFITYISIC